MLKDHLFILVPLSLSLISLPACGGSDPKGGDGATETNVAPAPCAGSDECPEGVECLFENPGDEMGYCDVAEATAGEDGSGRSLGAPAPCAGSDECPEGVLCLFENPGDEFGYCDVAEVTVGGDGSDQSLGAPAPCESVDDCPEGIECMKFDEAALGFCDVTEHSAE